MIDREVLRRLAQTDTGIIPTKEGAYSLSIGGQWIHSKYSPEKEAERLISDIIDLDPQSTLVIILGVGLGYHVDLLEKKGFKNLILIELNTGVWSYFQKVYKLENPAFWLTPQDPPEQLDAIFSEIQLENFKSIKTLVLRGSYDPEIYKPYEQRLQRLIKVKLGDFSTRFYFEELWFINILKNLAEIEEAIPIRLLTPSRQPVPVILVSAGPSLKQSVQALAVLQKKCVIIAVDTALLSLYEAGVQADFVYSLDSQVHNLSDFSFIDPEYLARVNLVYDVVVNPSLTQSFKGRKIMANTAHLEMDPSGNPVIIKHQFVDWIEKLLDYRIGDVETGGSVATSAFHLAYMLGGEPIILVGQDLAYSYMCSHCPSTSHYYRIRNLTCRTRTLDSIFLDIMGRKEVFQVNAQHNKVYTDHTLTNYRGWFEESARNILSKNKINLINASKQGARIAHFQALDIDALAQKYRLLDDIDKDLFFNKCGLKKQGLNAKIKKALQEISEFVESLGAEQGIFDKIENSKYPFLDRYFLKEKTMWRRYQTFEDKALSRKLYRLKKTLNGVINAR